MQNGRRNMAIGIICLIFIIGLVAIASASETAPSPETGHEVAPQETHETLHEAESHEAAPEVHEGAEEEAHGAEAEHEEEHAVAGEHSTATEEHGEEGEHEVSTREYGAPAAYFFIGAIILLLYFVMARYKYDNISDLSRKIPGLIAVTIYIFSIMVIAHYVAGAWSLILVPVFLFVVLKFWPHI